MEAYGMGMRNLYENPKYYRTRNSGTIFYIPFSTKQVHSCRRLPQADSYINSKFQIGTLIQPQTCDELSHLDLNHKPLPLTDPCAKQYYS